MIVSADTQLDRGRDRKIYGRPGYRDAEVDRREQVISNRHLSDSALAN